MDIKLMTGDCTSLYHCFGLDKGKKVLKKYNIIIEYFSFVANHQE